MSNAMVTRLAEAVARESKRKGISPSAAARKSERRKEARRIAREAQGFRSAAEMRAYAYRKTVELRRARKAAEKAARAPIVIQPSVSKRQTMVSDTRPGETVAEFRARGGKVEVLPGFQSRKAGPIPARHWTNTGARSNG